MKGLCLFDYQLAKVNLIYAGKSGISAGIVVAIVVSIVLALLLLIFACLFINRRRAKRKYNSVPEESGMIYKLVSFKTLLLP